MLRKFRYISSVGYLLLFIAFVGLHFIIKDSSYKTSLWFYALPLPVGIGGFFLGAFAVAKSLRRYAFLGVALLSVVWLMGSLKWHVPKPQAATDVNVLFWNASNAFDFKAAFAMYDGIPDVAVLVEYTPKTTAALKGLYPEYDVYLDSIQNIGIFSKTPIDIKTITRSKYQSAVINFKTRGFNFYAVDVSGSIDVPRAWELDVVSAALLPEANTVVLGDFNVPYESLLLGPIKSNFKHAFSEKGFGLKETWCYGLPILSLDHIWLSQDVKLKQVTKQHTLKSDHAMLKMVLE